MSIVIYPPVYLYEKGKRETNEDFIFPIGKDASDNDRLFIICDGVGGHVFGEIASKLACEALIDYNTFEENFIPERALVFIETRFMDFIELESDYKGMATTMVFLKINDNNCMVGWVGDSRLYFVRDGEILYQTEDHSLVNSLIKKGEMTLSEAKNDLRKNIITNVISGTAKAAKIDSKVFNDINSGDYFLLCSDGLLENIDDTIISAYLIESNSPEYIRDSFLKICQENTSDNYSMYLLKFK